MGIWYMGQEYDGHTHDRPSTNAWLPKYTLPLNVIDSLVGTLPRLKRKQWRRIRNQALALWGVPHVIERGPAITWVGGWMDPMWPNYFTKNTIRFVQFQPDGFPAATWGPHLQWTDTSAGVIALAVDLSPDWWQTWAFRQWRALVAHEFGHTIGFGHPHAADNAGQIMAGANKPSELELAVVRDYYSI